MPEPNQTNNVRSDGAFDAFASQAANSAELLGIVKHISDQTDIIARNTSLYRTANGSAANGRDSERVFRDRYESGFNSGSSSYRPSSGFNQRAASTFEEGILEGLSEGLLGFNWKDALSKGLNNFAQNLGISLKDLPGQIGKQLTKQSLDAFKQTSAGKAMMSKINEMKSKLIKELGPDVVKMFTSSKGGASAFNIFGSAAKGAGANAAAGATSTAMASGTGTAVAGGAGTAMTTGAGAAAGGAAGGIGAAGPYALIILAVMIKLQQLADAVSPAVEGVKLFADAIKAAGNRYNDERKKYAKLAATRLAEDTKTMIQEPFNILKDSAQKVEAAWDSTLNVIGATQGYTKEQTQTLMAYVADRLREDELTSVVSAASIIEKLPDVLREGLSGRVAEEFAYQASILNAAIPTQDFFSYASSYSSIVANMVKDGKSQAEAIEYANTQLKQFANNILYASRTVAGGTSTGLKNAQTLFEQSVRIAQAGRTVDISNISGVMTTVAGIVGAIAPDLATSITDAVYQAAVGGNESSIVALRSLAGGSASNTAFLRALLQNPQQVFEQLFRNLANIQNMSADAYMEVADQVSTVFGLSRDAFARIDFNYLADAIHSRDANSAALLENMTLLQSGQTTLTKDQLRNQQINQYMLEEGLALVLDSEVGRAIQQHMWDEQLAREIIEAEYGVNIVGSAMQLWEGIKVAIDGITTVLDPLGPMKKIITGIDSIAEGVEQQVDLTRALRATEVGSGHNIYPYVTRNASLNLTKDYLEILTGYTSSARSRSQKISLFNKLTNITGQADLFSEWITNQVVGLFTPQRSIGYGSKLISMYAYPGSYGSISKSASQYDMLQLQNKYEGIGSAPATSKSSSLVSNLQRMIDDLKTKFDVAMSFEDWVGTASKYGIASWEAALQEAGYAEQSLRNLYAQYGAQASAAKQEELANKEHAFWEAGTKFWQDRSKFPDEISDLLSPKFDQIYSIGSTISDSISNWKSMWTDYYITHTIYNRAFDNLDYAALLHTEKSSTATAVDKLASALVTSVTDLSDPAAQTNTILAQILMLLTQLVQQNAMSPSGQPSLGSTLMELALGRSK